jgi:hypothetical protein
MMRVNVIERNGKFIIEGPLDGEIIEHNVPINDILSATYEYDTRLLLLPAESLPKSFFDLSTMVAGDILQKFTNYQIIAAVLITEATKLSTRFPELERELQQQNRMMLFYDRDDAITWLFGR